VVVYVLMVHSESAVGPMYMYRYFTLVSCQTCRVKSPFVKSQESCKQASRPVRLPSYKLPYLGQHTPLPRN